MDIRIPIGLLFSVVGAIISAWGAFGGEAAKLDEKRLGAEMAAINMNLWWGLVLLAFGLFMLGLAACSCRKKKAAEAKKACGTDCGCK